MELEFFCKPGTQTEWFEYWRSFCYNWLLDLGINKDNLRLRDHDPEELSFYSDHTTDIEYAFPFTDWGELWGIASRTDYDLTQHQNTSGEPMEYFDDETKEKYVPYVIEPSLGADRVTLAFLCEAYDEEVLDAEKNDVRTVLHFHPAIAPITLDQLYSLLSKKLGEGAERGLCRALQSTRTVSSMTEEISVRDTVVRMKSVLHSVSHTTSIQKMTVQLRYVTEIQWSRRELK